METKTMNFADINESNDILINGDLFRVFGLAHEDAYPGALFAIDAATEEKHCLITPAGDVWQWNYAFKRFSTRIATLADVRPAPEA